MKTELKKQLKRELKKELKRELKKELQKTTITVTREELLDVSWLFQPPIQNS